MHPARLKSHWQQWFNTFSSWTTPERSDHSERLNQVVRETGIAYDLFADTE